MSPFDPGSWKPEDGPPTPAELASMPTSFLQKVAKVAAIIVGLCFWLAYQAYYSRLPFKERRRIERAERRARDKEAARWWK